MVKIVDNGHILAVSATAKDGVEITEQEYNDILSALQSRPEAKDGFALMLKDESLAWEYVETPTTPEDDTEAPTEDKAEAYDILMGEVSE